MKDILNLKTSLPTLSPERFSLDFFGKYFDYKRDTKLIRLETIKVREQAEIIRKEIDARLKDELDKNSKKFQKEMFRLKHIAESLENGRENRNKLLNELFKLMRSLNSSNLSKDDKEFLLLSIRVLIDEIREERKAELEKIKELRDFDPNRKLLK